MIVISPAKRLSNKACKIVLNATTPTFDKEASLLANELAKLNAIELTELMGVSDNIAELNVERFKSWGNSPTEEKRAIFQFEGDVFKHLDARNFNDDDIGYMNQRLRILSGIYGLLKPSDEMNPYRLEMGTQYAFGDSKNLYDFWGDKIATQIKLETKGNILFNLASEEYFSSIKKHTEPLEVINFKFLSISGGKERVVGVTAKRARGEMAKFLIQNRIEDTTGIEKFSAMGFKFKNFENNTFIFAAS
ncbi:MAG: peroxide stress protein YaaA [Gammaproteobacteria bacterium]|nr:peroxide stress protein YaaA [Gammaproteobacteria bacterium]|tara:strand:+ start:1858 stop:2601 length:744 start_codon:yes stop_codon:yes gene_type:complete